MNDYGCREWLVTILDPNRKGEIPICIYDKNIDYENIAISMDYRAHPELVKPLLHITKILAERYHGNNPR